MATKYIVNNVPGQTINGQIFVPTYQVYTALLRQSGGDDPQYQQSGDLIIGRTYEIGDNGVIDWDFTNVGAPSNEVLTKFVATGTTPANWGQNGVLNYNTGAPVVTVLENTIGNIWFIYRGDGNYGVKSDGLFIVLKSTMLISNVTWDGGSGIIKSGFDSAYDGFVVTALVNGDPINNGSLINTPIEIRVYN